MAKDPICGMIVEENKTKFKSEYNGKPTISALPPAKQLSTNLQQNMLATQLLQGTVAIVATTIANQQS